MQAASNVPSIMSTKRRRRQTTRRRWRSEVGAGRTAFARAGGAGSPRRTSWIDRAFGNGRKAQMQESVSAENRVRERLRVSMKMTIGQDCRGSGEIATRNTCPRRRGPQRVLAMCLSFAQALGGKRDGPGVQNE